jgi:hypothetical protein
VIDETEANAIQPAPTPQDVLADGWIGEKVNKRMTDHSEHVDLKSVSIGIKAAFAVRNRVGTPVIKSRPSLAAPQDNRHCNTGIAVRIAVNLRERKLMHCLPAAEG